MNDKTILLSTVADLKEAFSSVILEMSKTPPVVPAERKKLNRAQAARFCGVSYHTFGSWVRADKIKERGLGRKNFFYKEDLIEALQNGDK